MRWWAALGLLRAAASSPAAASATLRNKLRSISAQTPEEVDDLSRPLVLDEDVDETSEAIDIIPGVDTSEEADEPGHVSPERERLLELAREADLLKGDRDPKLLKVVKILKDLLDAGHRPIVFCRFIATSEYLGDELRARMPKSVTTIAVTGNLPPDERINRIQQLAFSDRYVLVCTDCLSEGVNLQQYFDAVIHYDLSWNPTRHEQREGRVDRYGQVKPVVRIVTYYGTDNQIDGVVLQVLIKKHKKIRKALGISIPVPTSSNTVLEALYEGLLLKNRDAEQLLLFDDMDLKTKTDELNAEWQNAADREEKSRSLFAQHRFDEKAVLQEVTSIRAAIGSSTDVRDFVSKTVRSTGGTFYEREGLARISLKETPAAIREITDGKEEIVARFQLPVSDREIYLSRTHPLVEGLATFVMETALDPQLAGQSRVPGARCGAIRTRSVETRTTLLLLRMRFHILTTIDGVTKPLLAEDSQLVAFRGAPSAAEWLEQTNAESLLNARPDENVTDDVARKFIRRVVDDLALLNSKLDEYTRKRGEELLAAHKRVRQAGQRRGIRETIEPQLPADVLGLYVFLPLS
jgi:superfamily II DNA/RNA helicase